MLDFCVFFWYNNLIFVWVLKESIFDVLVVIRVIFYIYIVFIEMLFFIYDFIWVLIILMYLNSVSCFYFIGVEVEF